MPSEDRVRVAVVGGGCGGLTAAFELSKPEQRGRFDVTVYQMGWRLGGKGASGRGAAGRIEEHALHVWLGFYENAFRMLRDCHAALNPDAPDAWRKDFIEDSFIALARDSLQPQGAASPAMTASAWAALFPPTPGLPGDPFVGDSNPFAVVSYLRQAVRLLRSLMGGLAFLEKDPVRGFVDKDFLDLGPGSGDQRTAIRRALETMLNMWKLGFLSSSAGILTSINLIEQLIIESGRNARKQRDAEKSGAASGAPGGSKAAGDEEHVEEYIVIDFIKTFADTVRKELQGVVHADAKFSLRWQIVDLVLAVLVGAVKDGLLTHPDGLDAINHYDCREWLKMNGASDEAVHGAFVNGLFSLGFANEEVSPADGEVAHSGVAAGQALRGALRMFFTYRGAMFWKMRAGMGDVVFAPLYQVLKNRGVKFKFFHRLENVGMTFPDDPQAAPFVSSLDFDVQAGLMAKEYDPLMPVKGRACWPSKPRWAQLHGFDAAASFESFFDRTKDHSLTLRVSKDFDYVVLGISKGGIQYACREILANKGAVGVKWSNMVKYVPTVPTQALQVWLRADMSTLGWHDESVTLTGIPAEFDTWADMRQVVPAEGWLPGREPLTVAYFCGPLKRDPKDNPDEVPQAGLNHSDHPKERERQVRDNAVQFLQTSMAQLWRGADVNGAFDWRLLVDADNLDALYDNALEGIDSQFWVANINPSDQYVLATAGSIKYRISPLATGIDNLTIAGDWTACGFTEGCVEAAVMSGKLASHAISLLPKLEDIVGYDHP